MGKNHGLGPGHLVSISSSAKDQQCDAQQATPTFSFFICQMEQLKGMIPECLSPSPVAGFSEELFAVMTQAWRMCCRRGTTLHLPFHFRIAWACLHVSLVHHGVPFHMCAVLPPAPMTSLGGWGPPRLFLWIFPQASVVPQKGGGGSYFLIV